MICRGIPNVTLLNMQTARARLARKVHTLRLRLSASKCHYHALRSKGGFEIPGALEPYWDWS